MISPFHIVNLPVKSTVVMFISAQYNAVFMTGGFLCVFGAFGRVVK
jgi:hypothetical protein